MSAHEAHPAWSFHFLPFFTSTSNYKPLRCVPIVITEPIQRSRRHFLESSSVTVRGARAPCQVVC